MILHGFLLLLLLLLLLLVSISRFSLHRIANESMMRLTTSIGQTGTVEDQAAIEDAMQEFESTKQELVTAAFFADQGKRERDW
jgi:hypothetical protein